MPWATRTRRQRKKLNHPTRSPNLLKSGRDDDDNGHNDGKGSLSSGAGHSPSGDNVTRDLSSSADTNQHGTPPGASPGQVLQGTSRKSVLPTSNPGNVLCSSAPATREYVHAVLRRATPTPRDNQDHVTQVDLGLSLGRMATVTLAHPAVEENRPRKGPCKNPKRAVGTSSPLRLLPTSLDLRTNLARPVGAPAAISPPSLITWHKRPRTGGKLWTECKLPQVHKMAPKHASGSECGSGNKCGLGNKGWSRFHHDSDMKLLIGGTWTTPKSKSRVSSGLLLHNVRPRKCHTRLQLTLMTP